MPPPFNRPGTPPPIGLTNWRKLVGAAKGGISGGKLLWTGDSTVSGQGVTTLTQSSPYVMYQTLLAAGLPVVFDAFCGELGTDSRQVLSGGAVTGNPFRNGVLGYTLSASGHAIAHTPVNAWDTCDIYNVQGGIAGIASINVNGGAPVATLSTLGGADVKTTITNALGVNTLNTVWTSGTIWPLIYDYYDSTQTKIRVIGGGVPGSNSADFSDPAYYMASGVITALAPKVTIWSMGINDWEATGVSLATFKSQCQTFIKNAKALGDILLVGENSIGDGTTEGYQQQYRETLKRLAVANGLTYRSVLDIDPNAASYYLANLKSWMTDFYHPKPALYALIGAYFAQTLLAAL